MAMLEASGITAVMMATALKILPTSLGSTQRLNRDLVARREIIYNLGRPLIHVVLFCFLLEVPVTNWAAQQLHYQPNGRCNM